MLFRHGFCPRVPAFSADAAIEKRNIIQFFNDAAPFVAQWRKWNGYYHKELGRLLNFFIPDHSSVLEVGCGGGDLLSQLKGHHVKSGIDFSEKMIDMARLRNPDSFLECIDIEELEKKKVDTSFDYIVMSDLVSHLYSIQKTFENVLKVSHTKTRLIITTHNFLWEPVLRLCEKIGLKMPQPHNNWVSGADIAQFLECSDFEVVKSGTALMLPIDIPVLSWLFNRILVRLPFLRHLGSIQYVIARRKVAELNKCSVSIVIPARNEAGNIEDAVLRMPEMGVSTEIIFVEGHSTDATWEEIVRVSEKFKNIRKIKILKQEGNGKGDAVREGFKVAGGDVIGILDADLTMPPEELPQFFNALVHNKADFVNGSRLVYRMEKQAMQFLNILGNKLFSYLFTWMLERPIKDTLCGTKMLWRKDYERIAANRYYFGEFDPFGDFDLLFGASKLNLKIIDMPIHYRMRKYGNTNINRWKHGILLLKMVAFAMKKLKFF